VVANPVAHADSIERTHGLGPLSLDFATAVSGRFDQWLRGFHHTSPLDPTALAACALHLDAGMIWTDHHREERVMWIERHRPELVDRFGRVVSATGRILFADLDPGGQVHLDRAGPASTAPTTMRDEGRGLGARPRRALWTSTTLPGTLTPWLWFELWDNALWPGEQVHGWQVRPSGTARIYEVHGPEEWVRLCDSYPADSPWWGDNGSFRSGPWIAPNWDLVAAEFDAIHLSLGGYLTTQLHTGLTCARGPTALVHWDHESTAWLNHAFDAIDDLGDITV
jgi:hypothetical protein